MCVLLQGMVDGICSGWVHTCAVFKVGADRAEQTVALDPDPAGWKALGSRHDRTDMYGVKPLERVLSKADANIMFLLYPINVVPMGPIDVDMHKLRPNREYPVWRHELPEGYVTLDSVQIEFQ